MALTVRRAKIGYRIIAFWPQSFRAASISFWEALVIVDRAWIGRNIGVDPATVSIPKSAFATSRTLGSRRKEL